MFVANEHEKYEQTKNGIILHETFEVTGSNKKNEI
jgi:hypothetical protein